MLLLWIHFVTGEILNKLKSEGFLTSRLSTDAFFTLYAVPHNLIKGKSTEFIEQTSKS